MRTNTKSEILQLDFENVGTITKAKLQKMIVFKDQISSSNQTLIL
ncbi:hypothetical protein LEP1GSC186_2900 [Leptospira noguchii serovar Autumnalis str. ZUN142]|uniref:Uncharacterized protein n=1 Tax=Leptospira noguchii serovar Autumnalis str. ZUN142 TaxID=1085540 RepID=M6U7A8_9LEPT|nr:hypothetical protein LEP1GSC186_2900 [Leptospira noguchii serovar Autumnalis str. ZUN142]